MGWFQQVQSVLNARCEQPALPRKVLRHLIVGHDFGVGSRILDVGCGRGELVTFLNQLGFETTGLDESRESVAAAREAAPHLDYRCGRPHEIARVHEHCYDLILIRSLEAYRGNLFSRSAFAATAQLLSCVRPGGRLVFLVPVSKPARSTPAGRMGRTRGRVLLDFLPFRTGRFIDQPGCWGHETRSVSSQPDPDAERPVKHRLSCFQTHLASFPGKHESGALVTSSLLPEAWRSMLGGSGAGPRGFMESAIEVPAMPLSPEDWHRWADDAAARHRTPCCRQFSAGDPQSGRSAA